MADDCRASQLVAVDLIDRWPGQGIRPTIASDDSVSVESDLVEADNVDQATVTIVQNSAEIKIDAIGAAALLPVQLNLNNVCDRRSTHFV